MRAQDEMIANLASTLRSARRFIQSEYDSLLESVCRHHSDGSINESDIDPLAKPSVARFQRILKRIDGALQ